MAVVDLPTQEQLNGIATVASRLLCGMPLTMPRELCLVFGFWATSRQMPCGTRCPVGLRTWKRSVSPAHPTQRLISLNSQHEATTVRRALQGTQPVHIVRDIPI